MKIARTMLLSADSVKNAHKQALKRPFYENYPQEALGTSSTKVFIIRF